MLDIIVYRELKNCGFIITYEKTMKYPKTALAAGLALLGLTACTPGNPDNVELSEDVDAAFQLGIGFPPIGVYEFTPRTAKDKTCVAAILGDKAISLECFPKAQP